jgi:hypothetical protein
MPGLSVIIDAIKEICRYPEAPRFTQPLSGIIAGRRDYLIKLTFEDDYGVDVGLLLDAAKVAAVKAATQTAVRSAGRRAVGRVGSWRARGYAFGGFGRQTRRDACELKGEVSLPFR